MATKSIEQRQSLCDRAYARAPVPLADTYPKYPTHRRQDQSDNSDIVDRRGSMLNSDDTCFRFVDTLRRSQHTMSNIAIVVPCYNEFKRLHLKAFEEFLNNFSVHFMFVDDGSTDDTAELIESFRRGREDRVSLIALKVNCGKAEAVRQGMEFALNHEFDFVGFWDSDLATPLATILQFMKVFSDNPQIDIVFGSRVKLLGHEIKRQAIRHYLGRVFATVVALMLKLPVYDTQCGAKIFRVGLQTRDLTRDAFRSRWIFDVELIERFIRLSGGHAAAAKRIYEYPLDSWEDVGGSKVKPIDFFIAFRDIIRICWVYRER
jgi:dolichyl-phosphate beta-glucosyltransferase